MGPPYDFAPGPPFARSITDYRKFVLLRYSSSIDIEQSNPTSRSRY